MRKIQCEYVLTFQKNLELYYQYLQCHVWFVWFAKYQVLYDYNYFFQFQLVYQVFGTDP